MSFEMSFEADDAENVDYFQNDYQQPLEFDEIETITENEGKDDPQYEFSNGLCLIFHHENFDKTKSVALKGTTVDKANLMKMFKQTLGFTNVEYFQDLTKCEIEDRLNYYASDSCDVNYDCLVCFVLTHGTENKLRARDKTYDNDIIHTKFRTSANFTKLRGKPKLFFYVACQGPKHDEGIDNNQVDATKVPFVPENDDFLLVLSSVPGFKSRINQINGSIYVQHLLCALKNSVDKKIDEEVSEDIHAVLTTTNRLVAFEYEGIDKETKKRVKQMPIFFSTFRDNFVITRNVMTPRK